MTHKELPIIDSLIIKNDFFEDLRGIFITSWEEYNPSISIKILNRFPYTFPITINMF